MHTLYYLLKADVDENDDMIPVTSQHKKRKLILDDDDDLLDEGIPTGEDFDLPEDPKEGEIIIKFWLRIIFINCSSVNLGKRTFVEKS